jgi:hypothetical protein
MPHAAFTSGFVIMPFDPQFRAGYDDVIAPGMRAAGLAAVRADQEELGHIHGMMFERIFKSPVVIADVSGANPNVFYELGVSHSTAAKTITVVREDYREAIPFDIAPYRVLVYPGSAPTTHVVTTRGRPTRSGRARLQRPWPPPSQRSSTTTRRASLTRSKTI